MYTLIPAGGADRPPRKVIFLGLRGIPEIQGGVETHVAALAVRIAQRGWQVEVLGRRPYLPSPEPYVWNGVRVTPIWTPRSKNVEALLHTTLGLFAAARRSDLVHIHAIGPALLTPLARLLGLRVVVTHRLRLPTPEWGRMAKSVLRAGWMGMRFTHARISRKGIVDSVRARHGVAASFIRTVWRAAFRSSLLDYIGVTANRYICASAGSSRRSGNSVISAFARLNDPGRRLIIVDTAITTYCARSSRRQQRRGRDDDRFPVGEASQLYRHAALFVLPSSHEHTDGAARALSHGVPCLASDIGNLALDRAGELFSAG